MKKMIIMALSRLEGAYPRCLLKTAISSFFILASFSFASACTPRAADTAHDGEPSTPPVGYILDNAKPWDEFRLSPETLASKRLYMFGEAHYIAETDRIKASAIAYLIREAGVEHIVIEQNAVIAAMLDYYLASGEVAILDWMEDDRVWSFSTPGDRAFYESIHDLVATRPGTRRIRVVGYEASMLWNSLSFLCRYLSRVLDAPSSGADSVYTFIHEFSRRDADPRPSGKRASALLIELGADEERFRQRLGPRYDLIHGALSAYLGVLDSWARAYESDDAADDGEMRERVLYRRIADLYRSCDDAIAVWYGSAHTSMQFGAARGYTRFGTMLRNDVEIATRLTSLAIVYLGCELSPPDDASVRYYSDFPYSLSRLEADLPPGLSFLPTRGAGSPLVVGGHGAKPLSYYADYLIFVRGVDDGRRP